MFISFRVKFDKGSGIKWILKICVSFAVKYIYRHGNMIEHEQFSEFSESHLLPFMFCNLPRGKMIQLTTHF